MTAAIAETSLGPILVAASEAGIYRVEFGDDESTLREKLDADYPDATLTIGSDFEQWLTAVVQQIDSPRVQRPLPLDLRGTPFQQRVWEALLEQPLVAGILFGAMRADLFVHPRPPKPDTPR